MTAQRSLLRLAPALLWLAVLTVGYGLILFLNHPGHMSVDSVISLVEGRTGVRLVFGPPMFSSILGFFDRITPGSPFAYVCGAALLLVLSWAAMPSLRGRVAWIAPFVLAGAMLAPQVLIYQAIAWKDVLFANFAIAGFVTLAHAVKRWDGRGRLQLLALAFLLLAVACLLRQNGALVCVFSAATLAWAAWNSGWRKALAWAAAGFAIPLVLSIALNAVTPVKDPPGETRNVGMRLLQGYDLAGAIAENPNRPLRALEADNPQAAADLRVEAPKYYSPVRIDALLGSKTLGRALVSYDTPTIGKQWAQTLIEDPVGYARRRLEVFRWVFLTPDIDKCLPVHLGLDGPPKHMRQLGIRTRQGEVDDTRLWNYTTWWMDTPGLSHPAYAALALAVTGFLLLRRERADIAMAGLMLTALSFAASFYVISLACDYRYLYFLDLAALTGLAYVALDPRIRRRTA